MFDYGLDTAGVMNNIGLLGIDIGKASAFPLSHGHYDHYSSAVGIIKQNEGRIPGRDPLLRGRRGLFPTDSRSVPDHQTPLTSDSCSGPISSFSASRWWK